MELKNFSAWHTRKALLNRATSLRYPKEREVWWLAIGHNVGSEEDGKGPNFSRPVLVYKVFSTDLLYGIPLSTTTRRGPYYHPLVVNGVSNVALLTHMRDLDQKRLINKMGRVSLADYDALRVSLLKIL